MKIELDFLLEHHEELSELFFSHIFEITKNNHLLEYIKFAQYSSTQYVFQLYYFDVKRKLSCVTFATYIQETEDLLFNDIYEGRSRIKTEIEKKTQAFIRDKSLDLLLEE
jgi:hypothetical protein